MLAALLLVTAPTVQTSHVQLIDSTPGAFIRSQYLSADGSIASGTLQIGSLDVPFAWSETQGFRLLNQSGPGDGFVLAMGAGGTHIAGQYYEGFFQDRQAARWDLHTGERIDIVPAAAEISSARHISADGTVVAGEFENSSGLTRGFRWTETGGVQDLGTLSGLQAFVRDMNRDGTVVVGFSFDAIGRRRAFRWTPTNGMRRVNIVGSARDSVEKVSHDGQVLLGRAEGAAYPSGLFHRVLGQPPTEIPLGGVAPALAGSLLLSGDGSTAAGLVSLPGGGFEAFVWTAATGTVFIPEQEVDQFTGISADGSTLVGFTTTPAGVVPRRPLRWTFAGGTEFLDEVPPDDAAPECVSDDGTIAFGYDRAGNRSHPAFWRSSENIGESYCGPAVPNSTGGSAEMRLTGSNSLLLDELTLEANGIPVGSFGYFVASTAPGFVFPVSGSEGALCLDGGIGRFVGPGQVLSADASGQFSLTVRPGQFPSPTGAQSAAYGESWFFQAWFRDANPAVTSNFTDGATVRFY